MVSEQVNIRLDPMVKEKIEQLVAAGEYASVTEFIKQTIQFYLNYQQFKLEDEERLIKVVKSETGRALLRELIEEIKENKSQD